MQGIDFLRSQAHSLSQQNIVHPSDYDLPFAPRKAGI